MKYIIGEPFGPSGPFFSVIREDGRVIALQIPERDMANKIVKAISEYDELIAKVNYYESVVGLADVLVDIPIDPDKAHLPPPF